MTDLQGCSFPSREMHYKCLGSWKAADGQNYLALMDTELPQLGEEIRPRYRCGVRSFSSYLILLHQRVFLGFFECIGGGAILSLNVLASWLVGASA